MDISGISSSVSANSFATTAAGRGDLQRMERIDEAQEVRQERTHHDKGRGRALGIFRQELRMQLKAEFHARYADSQHGYALRREPASSDDVAAEALAAAKQIAAEEPTKAARSLISFRAKVHETASYVRETVGNQDDVVDVDDAVAAVDGGLNALEDDVAANRESSASVLAVDSRTRQRSTIKIRTQEGDVVKLSLKRADNLSATDAAHTDGNTSVTSTEVEVSSRSRMMLRVEGDLNESEMAAIKNVFAQAEQIADEFFGGDIGAAFNLAQGFEFDTEQLARVNMRFKLRQDTHISYTETVRPATLAPAEVPNVTTPAPADSAAATTPVSTVAPAVIAPETDIPPAPAPMLETQPVYNVQPVIEGPIEVTDGMPVAEQPVALNSPAAPDTSALASFFESLSAFLQTVGEGFSASSGSASFSYHYSESFKLELLKSVLHTVAPDESVYAAQNAELLIDSIANEGHTGVE